MSSNLEIVVWDVQHGNAIYMKSPNGRHVMFDIGTGSYDSGTEFSPLCYLKYKSRVNRLDYLVISHPHADHISDIRNMYDLCIKPFVLCRPRNINSDLIYKGNQPRHSEIVDYYLKLDDEYNGPVSDAQNPNYPENFGGVKISRFYQSEQGKSNLNNYSIVVVIEYVGEKIIIPGDIEEAGWKVLLERTDFQQTIEGTTIFVASHHGRASGFYSNIFSYFRPEVVIVSDGRFSDTSVTGRYGYYAQGATVTSRSTGNSDTRYVLTTRKDGAISIKVLRYGKQITIK